MSLVYHQRFATAVLFIFCIVIPDLSNSLDLRNFNSKKSKVFDWHQFNYSFAKTTKHLPLSRTKERFLYSKDEGFPVVLVPGDGGNQLRASLNLSEASHIYCTKHSQEFTLWLDLEELLPFLIECFTENIRLIYDAKTKDSYSPEGVNITVPGFGDTESVEWLDPSHLPFGRYFVDLVDAMVERGYKRGVSVRGAPYDFRKAPNTETVFFTKLKKLIEDTFTLNNNRKVVIITHSLGGLYGLYFLNHMEQSWKDKYIQSFAPISSPFAGAAKIMRLFASGDNLDERVINPLSVRPAQRTYPSSAFLMPSDKYWSADEILVQTPKKNYTVKNYDEFFTDLGLETAKLLRKDTKDLVYNITAPGVPVFHVHGKDMPTPAKFVYDDIFQFPDDQPHVVTGPGDGTVNMRSLKAFLKWKNEQKQPVEEYEIEYGEHLAILAMDELHQYLLKNVLFPH